MHKDRKDRLPLRLRKETLRQLDKDDLMQVQGGAKWQPRTHICTTGQE